MSFYRDLDGMTIWLTVITLAANCAVLGYVWPNRPVAIGRPFGLLLALASFCGFAAYDAYCPDADQPHLHLSGVIVPVQQYTYRASKSSHTGVLAYVYGAQPPVLLEFSESATAWVGLSKGPVAGTVTYLGRTEETNVGNGRYRVAHPVVEVHSTVTGERIFYTDTTRHWPRTIVLFGDVLIGIFTFGLCMKWSRSESDAGGDGGVPSPDEDAAVPDDLVGLGLSAGGQR